MSKKKSIIVACKESPERLPPVFSLLESLAKQHENVVLITSNTSQTSRKNIEKLGINIYLSNERKSIKGLSNIVEKGIDWIKFRNMFWKIRHKYKDIEKIWIATGDTAIAVGSSIYKEKYYLSLLELYDTQKIYLNLLKNYAQNASHVVTPEDARSAIFRYWFGLDYTPSVLPNKPLINIKEKKLEIKDLDTKNKLKSIEGKKLLLYQARMIRMELFDVAEAIDKVLGKDYVLGIMGDIRDKKMFENLKKAHPDLLHFNYLEPPDHLAVTQRSYIGLLIYNFESLNNIFCAPNKLWEFSCFGVPMITQEFPMLGQMLDKYGAGGTFPIGDYESIARIIKNIDKNYDHHSDGSLRLYNSFDFNGKVTEILEKY